KEEERMAPMDYSAYSPAVAQPGYSLILPCPLRDTQRPHRHKGKEVMEPMDNRLIFPLVMLLPLSRGHIVSLSRGTALVLMIPPLLQSLPPRPPLYNDQSSYSQQNPFGQPSSYGQQSQYNQKTAATAAETHGGRTRSRSTCRSGKDSDNSAIYMQGLNDNVTLDDLADFFKQCGVKMSKRTRQPVIHIYVDKETGTPKGNAKVSYEDPLPATAGEWFDGKDFQGSKLQASHCAGWYATPLGQRDATAFLWRPREPRRSWGNCGSHGRHRRKQEVSPEESCRVPKGTYPGEERSNTKLETGGTPIQGVESRTSPGKEVSQCKAPKSEGFLPGDDCGKGGPSGMRGGRGDLMDHDVAS
ncbi:RNA-binding protein FUS, partial [Galemys pyrenaicus]